MAHAFVVVYFALSGAFYLLLAVPGLIDALIHPGGRLPVAILAPTGILLLATAYATSAGLPWSRAAGVLAGVAGAAVGALLWFFLVIDSGTCLAYVPGTQRCAEAMADPQLVPFAALNVVGAAAALVLALGGWSRRPTMD